MDLVEFEELGFWWWDASGGDRRDALTDVEHLRGAGRDVFEQGVDRREPLVAGAGVVSAVLFEVPQERDDAIEREIADRELGELCSVVGGDEHDQQPDGVAVAADGRRPQAFDGDQVVWKKECNNWPSGVRGVIARSPSRLGRRSASNRRFASSSSSEVIVR